MATQATALWRLRTGGNDLNGGGYDAGISGAGTDYTVQDAAQLSLSDLATSGAGSTTLTSATGGFTSVMVGNCLQVASGTNFVAGWYWVTGYTNGNTVTLDASPTPAGAGASGVGKLGGALATFQPLYRAGMEVSPSVTTGVVAGNTIYVRGSGSDTPTSADYTQTGYGGFPVGLSPYTPYKIIGYNGRPRIHANGLFWYVMDYARIRNFYFHLTGNSNLGVNGCIQCNAQSHVSDLVFDQNGYQGSAVTGVLSVTGCVFKNTGGGSPGGPAAIVCGNYGGVVSGNRIDGWLGDGIAQQRMAATRDNIIVNCGGNGITAAEVTADFGSSIIGNTIDGNAGHGIEASTRVAVANIVIRNNIISNHVGSGKYGLAMTGAIDTADADHLKVDIDYNLFFNNTDHRQNISPGDHDIDDVDPLFTDRAAGNYTPHEPDLLAGFPVTIP